MNFRTLRADEIDCRVSQITEGKGLSLLLYKNARVDMDILDETVGAENWQRHHSRENANCTVSIWHSEKGMWVSKEDTGTESNTEAEKGLASDSFKRACVNWGIGRELYSAPFVWISAKDCAITQGKNGKPQCYDRFAVVSIEYDERRRISSLVIRNVKTGKIVFEWYGNTAKKTAPLSPKTEDYAAMRKRFSELIQLFTNGKPEDVASCIYYFTNGKATSMQGLIDADLPAALEAAEKHYSTKYERR